MTEEEYIENCAQRAREMAKADLQQPRFVHPFSHVEHQVEILESILEDIIAEGPDEYGENYEKVIKQRKLDLKRLRRLLAEMSK